MKLSRIKEILPTLENVEFQLEDGTFVPEHFHVTEVGEITKKFIDCGGVISLSENKLGIEDAEIEVEYQSTTIGKYDLEFNGKHFILKNKKTACLAEDACGIPVATENKFRVKEEKSSCCTPNSGCC